MTKAISSDEALEIAKKWLLNDPDEITRSETQNLISESGDEIIRRFGGSLLFGTAGIRGPRGAGPMRMNRLMVRVVASAIAKKLLEDTQNDEVPLVVVGYDARHQSQVLQKILFVFSYTRNQMFNFALLDSCFGIHPFITKAKAE